MANLPGILTTVILPVSLILVIGLAWVILHW